MDDLENPLRVALVCKPDSQPDAAQALILKRLADDPRITLAGKVGGSEVDPVLEPGWPVRAVLALERKLSLSQVAEVPVEEASALLRALPEVALEEVDIALALGRARLSTEDLGALRLGELSMRVGGMYPDADWLLVSPEVRKQGLISTEVMLRTATEPAPSPLASTAYNPKPSAVLSALFLAEKASLFLLKTLGQLHSGGPSEPAVMAHAPPQNPPGPIDLAAYLATVANSASARLGENLRERRGRKAGYWALSSGNGGVLDFDPSASVPLNRPVPIMADPFLFEHQGVMYVFYEAQNPDGKSAWIDVAQLEGERLVPLGTALRREYHLSFPHVFQDKDDIFMIPETAAARRLEVWRATRFPLEWELHATAFEGLYPADSTLFHHDGTWILMTNLSDHLLFQEHSSELYLFSCDGPSLQGLKPHPENPVVMGSATARNAGAVVAEDGRLFRPSQNNSFGIYGYGLNLMEIETLTPSHYSERSFRTFTPDTLPGASALHHASFAGGRWVIDWAGRK